MSTNGSSPRRVGQVECLVILVLLCIIGLIFIASLFQRPRGRKPTRITCLNHLKQVGLGAQLFAQDYNGRYPWQISTNEGGAKEWVGTRQTFRLFLVMTNELPANPRILSCPLDKERLPAADFARFGNENLSYFVGLDARKGSPTTLLFGDRNLSVSGYQLGNGSYYIPTSKIVTWAANIHLNAGNVVLNDGSAHLFNNQKLQTLLNGSGRATNFIAIP